ncbi:DNA alkylation repair protein [Streptomyces sp. IBSBF 2953]|uniref:DNA alkylation repair protein n=1 Tax=Streptomyces TaxID=1883 RepID=UPI002119FEFA|nr:DNA alkylation repair protein [Streptomyces scabiei]MCQ9179142.1 DNA alkylation repair protein [Streptomyces hayashii]MDX3116382.1 DNA alkylation repair protein [Streptomyces scabiei]
MTVTVAGPIGAPRSALADAVLERLTTAYAGAADPARAAAMRAYMKDVAPFLGLPTPDRRALSRAVLAGTPRPTEADCTAIALRCWALPHREYHYFAVDYLRRHSGRLSSAFLPVARRLITTTSWWDTVDLLAAHVVGALVAADPGLTADMDDWIVDEDLWVARTALLHQLRHKERTDADRLFAYCLRQSGHPDFFVRKAIGWCLREYAKTDPDAVRAFLVRERGRFAPLTVREALKNMDAAPDLA